MRPKWRSRGLEWRPPRSDWLSSPLSPDVYDTKQRWHKRYGRLGRRYETKTPEGPCVTDDHRPWELGYRRELRMYIDSLRGPRDLANRAIPFHDFGPSSDEQESANDKALEMDEVLSWIRPASDGAGSSPSGSPGGSASAQADENEDDESEELPRRYTAAEKGKQREGEPVPSSTGGPSGLNPAFAHSTRSLAPGMPIQGLRVPPRRHPLGNDEDEDMPSVKHVEHVVRKNAERARTLSKAREALARIAAANRLMQARVANGFAAQLPLDGLGVVRDRTLRPIRPAERSKLPSSSAMARTQSQMGVARPSSQADPVMMERTQSRDRLPDPNSEEYVDLVAESNRRLEDLSPYSPEDKVPDTPMPDLEVETEDRQPPPAPLLPPSESEDACGENFPPLENLTLFHAPMSPSKRNASEISGGCTPGPSSHRPAPRPAALSTTVATMSVDGHERPIS